MEKDIAEYNKLIDYLSDLQHHNLSLHLFSALSHPGAGSNWGAWPDTVPIFNEEGFVHEDTLESLKALLTRYGKEKVWDEGKEMSCEEAFPMVDRAAPVALAILDQILFFIAKNSKVNRNKINWRDVIDNAANYVSHDVRMKTEARIKELILYQHREFFTSSLAK